MGDIGYCILKRSRSINGIRQRDCITHALPSFSEARKLAPLCIPCNDGSTYRPHPPKKEGSRFKEWYPQD